MGVLLVIALLVARPGVNRLHSRIVGSISAALGREVDVSSVNLRLLPAPGFVLGNFVVHDDPAFGAEPMIRAEEVTASLRVFSLLRGRLEISHLAFSEPSLNLVRNSSGRWNLENLLERAAQIPVAPTSKARTETRPGFPYIESNRGRINLKFGQEKKPYALTDADFALWQESENAWGLRLRAQPVRADFNLTDTGTLRIDATWQRAATLRQTPFHLTAFWEQAQLGQVTKLAYGNDRGWRGAIELSAILDGTANDLKIQADAAIDDFRHYDIIGGGDFPLSAHCTAQYSLRDQALSAVQCGIPGSEGMITLDGDIPFPAGARGYRLSVSAQDLPLEWLEAGARHARNISDDLRMMGRLTGKVTVRRAAGDSSALWEGGGMMSGVHLVSRSSPTDIVLDSVPLRVAARDSKVRRKSRKSGGVDQPAGNRLDIGPFPVVLGRLNPATIQGWISASGYDLTLQGDAQVRRLLQAARLVGISAARINADGAVRADLQLAGSWAQMTMPRATGKAQLRGVTAEMRGMSTPLEIASANLTLTPEEIDVQNLAAAAAGTSWKGSLIVLRLPSEPWIGPVRFDLNVDELTTDELNRAFNPRGGARPWYGFLSSGSTSTAPYLLSVNASGRLTAERVVAGKIEASRVSGNVELANGKLRLTSLRGELLGGKHLGEWQADFTAKPPVYSGRGRVEQAELGQLAKHRNDGWISGSATASYQVTASGTTAAELLASAVGSMQVDLANGELPHVTLTDAGGPLTLRRLTAGLSLRDGKFEVRDGRLETPESVYQLSGTALMNAVVNLKLTRSHASGFSITGPVTEPRVLAIVDPETAASLKP